MVYLFVIIGILLIAAVGVIAYDSNRFVVRKISVYAPEIPKETTCLFISDLHNRHFGKRNETLIKALDEIEADCALLPGDIMTASKNAEFNEAVRLLEYLNKRMPVFYSYGNHESRARKIKRIYGNLFDRYAQLLSGKNIKLYDNETAEFNGLDIRCLTLPERFYYKRKTENLSVEELETLIGKPDPEKYTVLLAHDPEYFEAYSEYGAQLVLSGHFHGGIVRLFGHGLISPRFKLFPKYAYGTFEKNKTKMIVSAGLGGHTIPWRMFNPGEIVVLKLVPGKNK
ncbi:MAG: metallophosphoesterase [Lachnospiraceae bacterium]|nr:metallophosphoesterase [Lachnospiraceae bacterium]